MFPFVLVSSRPEEAAAEYELQSFLNAGNLDPAEIIHIQPESIGLPEIDLTEKSGIILGGSAYNTATAQGKKTATQLRSEQNIRHLLEKVLEADIPCLATGYVMEVLLELLGATASKTLAEPAGPVNLQLTESAKDDPLLQDLPSDFSVFIGPQHVVYESPENCEVLARSTDFPVQMFRWYNHVYAMRFNPELDSEALAKKLLIYTDAGYFAPDDLDELISMARTFKPHTAGTIVRRFVETFRRERGATD